MYPYHKRFVKLAKELGFSLNAFAKKGLGWKSYENLRRLSDSPKNKPSIDILEEVHEKFPNVNLDWLVTGVGVPFKDMDGDPIYLDNIPEDELQLAKVIAKIHSEREVLLEKDLFAKFIVDCYKSFVTNKNNKNREELRKKYLGD